MVAPCLGCPDSDARWEGSDTHPAGRWEALSFERGQMLGRQDRFLSGDGDLFNAPGRWAYSSGLGTYPEAPFG